MYALLSSHTHPNILIPVKAIVKDVKYDEINPEYFIKITKFYDNILFLKKYLLNMNFSNKFNKRARNFPLDSSKFTNKQELLESISGKNESTYYLIVDSIMTKKWKGEMVELFNKVSDHLIQKRFQENREMMTRIFYSGKYRMSGEAEYNARLSKFIGDKLKDAGVSIIEFFRLL